MISYITIYNHLIIYLILTSFSISPSLLRRRFELWATSTFWGSSACWDLAEETVQGLMTWFWIFTYLQNVICDIILYIHILIYIYIYDILYIIYHYIMILYNIYIYWYIDILYLYIYHFISSFIHISENIHSYHDTCQNFPWESDSIDIWYSFTSICYMVFIVYSYIIILSYYILSNVIIFLFARLSAPEAVMIACFNYLLWDCILLYYWSVLSPSVKYH